MQNLNYSLKNIMNSCTLLVNKRSVCHEFFLQIPAASPLKKPSQILRRFLNLEKRNLIFS